MISERVSALLVIAIVGTAHLPVRRILVNDFDEAFETAEKGRDFCRKVDQNIALISGIARPPDSHRSCFRVDAGQQLMWNKALLPIRPQQLIHVARFLLGVSLDHDAVLLMPGFLRDPATEKKPVMASLFIQDVEINPGHARIPALPSR